MVKIIALKSQKQIVENQVHHSAPIKTSVADRLGIATSVVCAVHCLLLPVLMSSLPFIGLELVHNFYVELGLMVVALVIGCFSFLHGYHKHHRLLPGLVFLAGFSCLLLNQLTDEFYLLILIPAAAVAIVTAHILNMQFSKLNTKKRCTHLDASF